MTDENHDKPRILIIDDEKLLAETIGEVLERRGYSCTVVHSGKAGCAKIDSEDFGIILTDLRLIDVDGMTIVRKVRKEHPDTEIMVITGNGDERSAVEALKQGAADYLTKPLDMEELRAVVDKSAEKVKLSHDIRELRKQLDEKFGFEGVIGNNPKMNEIIKRLKAVAPTKASVFVLGENGTGKELVARALHVNSPRKSKPFVAMNCASLNENLLDDEMFGHEPGAFTGADKLRKGRFEYANGGTLFLDEIGDMPLSLQAKLLRVLENGEVSRIGSNDVIRVDVRIVAATNKNMENLIKEGKFRQDLFQRLRVSTIVIPPLRERKEDLPLLTARFLKELSQQHAKKVVAVSDEIRKAFVSYDWPGNVRELRNQLESMVIFDVDGVLGVDDLQEGDPLKQISGSGSPVSGSDHLIGRPLAEVDRYYIERALDLTKGNRVEAAKLLGIAERTLYRDMQAWKTLDKIKEVLLSTKNDLNESAKLLGMSKEELEKKIKKLHLRKDDED
jgi:two-component system, NtrC family, response regulator HydG